tara:strand:+ start:442 stop:717 length:276 start_codon:yes stop_codon:yes gene_type:complete
MKDNGEDKEARITISVYPSERGFTCTVTEPNIPPLTSEYSIALTIAHGMVKLALDNPDLIFEAGVESLSSPQQNLVADLVEMLEERKKRLH